MSETIVNKSDSCVQLYSGNCASTNTGDIDISMECVNPVISLMKWFSAKDLLVSALHLYLCMIALGIFAGFRYFFSTLFVLAIYMYWLYLYGNHSIHEHVSKFENNCAHRDLLRCYANLYSLPILVFVSPIVLYFWSSTDSGEQFSVIPEGIASKSLRLFKLF